MTFESAAPQMWSQADWVREANEWIDSRLAGAGLRRTGKPDQRRIRSWATVWQILTGDGPVWFKASAPATAHEIAIYPLVSAIMPDIVLQPIAAHPKRPWILLPDGGTSLRDSAQPAGRAQRIEGIVPRYAELQRALMPKATKLLSLRVPDMRPEIMPQRFDEALEASQVIIEHHGANEDWEAYRAVASHREKYIACCTALAQSPVPPSLDHSDLHDNNILLRSPDDLATARVFDWGDSVVGHPFASMLVLLRSVGHTLGVPVDDPQLLRIRDAYLDVFTDLASRSELIELIELACRVSRVTRAVTWIHALEGDPAPNPDWVTAPWQWMRSILEPSYLG